MESLESIKLKISEFLVLDEPKKIAIIADNDEDGITAALNMVLFLKDRHNVKTYFFDRHLAKEKFAEDLRLFSPDKTIFLDLGGDFVEEALTDIADYTKEFVSIDHHNGVKTYAGAKFEFLKIDPDLFSKVDPSKYAVSKMVFDIFGGNDWATAVGIIGDSAAEQWKEFIDEVRDKYALTFEQLFDIMSTIVTIRTQHRGMRDELFNYLCVIDSPEKIFETDFYKLKKEFDKTLEEVRVDYEKNAERFPEYDLVFYFAKDNIVNPIINPLAKQNKNLTIIFYKKVGGLVNLSLRRGDFKVNLPELIKYAISEEPSASGGGHVPASGASFPAPYLETFKERVKTYLKEKYNNENN